MTTEHIAGEGGSEDSGYELTCGTPLPNPLCNNFETPHFPDLVHALHKQEKLLAMEAQHKREMCLIGN